MKRSNFFKTIQLIIYVLLAIAAVALLIINKDIYHKIAADPVSHLLFLFLWAIFALSFVFIYIDFNFYSSIRKDYRELDYAVHSDPLSGLSNRNSCDALIDKYADKPLPPDMGCIMFVLSNIYQINQKYGHSAGNEQIRAFANILNIASAGLCFVGRNGGNKFLAIFEDGSEQDIEKFLTLVKTQVETHNHSNENTSIEYKYGVAYHEGDAATQVTHLVALSNRRIP